MAVSPYIQLQIDNELTELSVRITRQMTTVFNIVADRIGRLRKDGYFLETVFINAQYVEHILKLIIYGYASRRRILELLGQKDIHEKVDLKLEDEETLGALIGRVRRLGGDPSLIRKLNTFNELRKEAIHHIFDGAKEIDAFNKQVGDYFSSGEFTKICTELASEQNKVSAAIQSLAKMARGEK